MEKRNVVERLRTPDNELHGAYRDWDKEAAAAFLPAADTQEEVPATEEDVPEESVSRDERRVAYGA